MINRLKLNTTCATLFFSLTLAGCSSTALHSPKANNPNAFVSNAEASEQLAESKTCCDSLQQLTYQPLDNTEVQYIAFDNNALSYNFESGKSLYKAYKIDKNISELKMTVSGLFYNTVFVPQILLLDSNFKKTRIISADKFAYIPAKFLNGDQLTASLTIKRPNLSNPNNETYFVIYTTQEAIQDTTTVTHPAKLDARARSLAEPNIADPVISHSAMGVVKIEFETENNSDDYVASEVASEPAPVEQQLQNNVTDRQFNEMITTAVENNEIEKAMQLVDQAEAAGSTSARDTFVDAIKK
ncbi:maltose operon protein [Psychromonas marina]|uniref:Maltose operon protein n=1 Tax=Psychromonas marina TaxID=88364 RepID=A0ABQ6E512_9GAMM|nr:MalM family protein [Psychromonas marina]GLS92273.1 maltose operon protein [Psychromonas marina]